MMRPLLFLLAVLLLWPATVAAEAPSEYRAALAETIRAAEAALAVLPEGTPLADYPPLRQALLRLESIGSVATDSGAAVAIDNRDLVKRLRGSRDEGRQALNSLRQLTQALDSTTDKTDWTKNVDFRSALSEVLARPEFRGAAGNPATSFLDELRMHLFQWLDRLFSGVNLPQLPGIDFGKGVTVLFWLLAGTLIALMIVFFAFVWRNARHSLARHVVLPGRRIIEREDAHTARMAAQQAADNGDYRQAIHYLYLWAVLHLSEQSRLRYDRSLTNREQLRALAIDGEVTEVIGPAVDTFDRIWYGHADCTATEYGEFRSAIERLVGAAT